jgi:hypothetical protein
VRYGAAMRLWAAGRIGDADLESWRVAAAHDAAGLMEAEMTAHNPDAAVARLIGEADRYLAGLSGPGIAEVRARIALAPAAQAVSPEAAVAPTANPVLDRWLAPALAAMDRPGLAAAIAGAAPHLAWTNYHYPSGQAGPAFPRAHAFATLIGDGGPANLPGFDLGLFLIAPGVFYRDHRHAAPELYAPLTGPHRWRFRPGAPLVAKPAHVPVWNPPHQPHATLAGAVPFLCLYAWTRDIAERAEMIPAPDWATIEAGP